MSDQENKPNPPKTDELLSRRNALKIAVATAPIIATLPSGAALARSSNLIGAAPAASANVLGHTLCVDLKSGTGIYQNGTLDLGAPASGNLTAITNRDYRTEAKGSAAAVTEAQMCNNGGSYYYQSGGWNKVTVPRGILVSATAISSFIGSINVTEV